VLAGAPVAVFAALRAHAENSTAVLQWGLLACIRLGQIFPCSHIGTLSVGDVASATARFCEAVKWRLPSAQIFQHRLQESGAPSFLVSVGCEADLHFACDLARGCGLHHFPENVAIRVCDSVPPSGITDAQRTETRANAGLAEKLCSTRLDGFYHL